MTKKTIDVVVPQPSYVFETRVLSVRIVTQLYGEISPERLTSERSIAQHRAEQLAPVIKHQRTVREDEDYANYDL